MPYLDFILYNPEDNDQVLLSEYLQNSLESSVSLLVYNLVDQESREISIRPRLMSKSDSLLTAKNLTGAEVKFERYDDAHEKVYMIDNVQLDSPAYKAGLGSGRMHLDPSVSVDKLGIDYIVGSRT